jgi:YesN/AraC family two-component response regulator
MGYVVMQTGTLSTHDFARAYYDESFQENSLGKHHHTQNEMVFVKEGQCVFDIAGKQHIIKKNQILLISALENHSTRVQEIPYRRYVFVSSMDLCSEYINDPVLSSAFIRSNKHHGAIELSKDLADEIEFRFKTLVLETTNQNDKWKERCAGILFDILILLYRSNPDLFLQEKNQKNLHVIFQIKDYLDQHYSEPLDLEVIAQKFYINKYYLSHQFKELIGYGFKRYIQLIRINKAKIFLQSTNLSVNEICSKVGYNNINYFIRLFKEKEELTPYQYRKLYFKGNYNTNHLEK